MTTKAYDDLVQKLLDEGSTKSQARRIAIQRGEWEGKEKSQLISFAEADRAAKEKIVKALIPDISKRKRGRPIGSKNKSKVK